MFKKCRGITKCEDYNQLHFNLISTEEKRFAIVNHEYNK